MAVDEIDYDGAASGIVAVLHERGIPISKVPQVFEDAMKLINQYTVPFDPVALNQNEQAEGNAGSETSSEQGASDEEANDQALAMMGDQANETGD